MAKEKRKTRILALGDVHGDEHLIKKAVEKSEKENVDIVILTGDITFANNPIKNIIGPFIKAKKQVLLIPGNHDALETIDFLAEYYDNTRSIHGHYFIKDDIGIFGAGGADVGPFRISEREIEDLLRKSHEKVKHLNKKIMVTHVHPAGTIMEKLTKFVPASKVVRKITKELKPDFLVHGHSHESAGLEDKIGKTRVFSVARKVRVFEI